MSSFAANMPAETTLTTRGSCDVSSKGFISVVKPKNPRRFVARATSWFLLLNRSSFGITAALLTRMSRLFSLLLKSFAKVLIWSGSLRSTM